MRDYDDYLDSENEGDPEECQHKWRWIRGNGEINLYRCTICRKETTDE
jgi:hypothetical protein